jgi:hypothetical protein
MLLDCLPFIPRRQWLSMAPFVAFLRVGPSALLLEDFCHVPTRLHHADRAGAVGPKDSLDPFPSRTLESSSS